VRPSDYIEARRLNAARQALVAGDSSRGKHSTAASLTSAASRSIIVNTSASRHERRSRG